MAVPAVLAPLCARPSHSAVFLDFDGTLAPIVDDPALARPLAGVPDLLADLGRHFGVVAVVSGRPGRFLGEHLGHPPGVRLIGLYGLEEVGQGAGPTVGSGTLDQWRPPMEALADQAEKAAPPGVSVERKTLGFTLHFRQAPEHARWVHRFAEQARHETSVLVQRGRMAIELRAGIEVDKGTVVRILAKGADAACCFGDDLGDVPAFKALGELAQSGMTVVRVAVADDESPRLVSDMADLVVDGPLGALELLREMLDAVPA